MCYGGCECVRCRSNGEVWIEESQWLKSIPKEWVVHTKINGEVFTETFSTRADAETFADKQP